VIVQGDVGECAVFCGPAKHERADGSQTLEGGSMEMLGEVAG